MPKINIDTEPRFKELLKELGFKKTKGEFVRPYQDALHVLNFGYSTNNERHVRYFNCIFSIQFPKVIEISKSIGEYIHDTGGQIGYIMPQKTFVEWRLAEDDTDDYYLNMIQEIIASIRDYVLPYMERFSTLQNFVDGVGMGIILYEFYDNKTIPVVKYLLGDKEGALKSIERILERYKRESDRPRGLEFMSDDVCEKIVIHSSPDRNYVDFYEFAEKLKTYIGKQNI